MTPLDIHDIIFDGLLLLLLIVSPVVVAMSVAGILAGLLVRFTRMQEPALGAVLRLLSVSAALALAFPWISSRFVLFTREIWLLLGSVG